jgi:hypothetical protein
MFAITGLISRGGLSNWVLFFFPDELIMVDVDAGPAFKAGLQVGVLGVAGEIVLENTAYGPPPSAPVDLRRWRDEIQIRDFEDSSVSIFRVLGADSDKVS